MGHGRDHVMGKAQEDLFVEHCGTTTWGRTSSRWHWTHAGKLMRSMYGTPDANEIFQKDYTEHLSSNGGSILLRSWMHVPHNLLSVAVASHPHPQKNYFTSSYPHHDIYTFCYWQIFGHSIWHIFWHIFWHFIWHILWHSTWHIFCNMFWHIFWHSIWHTFWHTFWHSIWHSIWQIFWHSIWQTFWHFIWHTFWHSFWHSIWHTFWYSIWHTFWYSIWHSIWHIF